MRQGRGFDAERTERVLPTFNVARVPVYSYCQSIAGHLWSYGMVDISLADGKLILHVRGADKLWALKSSLEIPLQHIAGVRADPSAAHGWYHGIRMPGTSIPGVITAGTFYQHGQRVFWDVHNPDNTIVIDLRDERYNELIVEVADPQASVQLIRAAASGLRGS
ncbi:MAG TPA: hypothetical protein VFP59_11465 [Candidatus Angelobacter sp.]|nr:hypothetical protein [Candidatus Angelobacter sp.]